MTPEQLKLQKMIDELQLSYNVLYGKDQSPKPEPQVITQQSLTESKLSVQQEMLLDLYNEFVVTDDGKALSANLNKFARWTQSKLAKAAQ